MSSTEVVDVRHDAIRNLKERHLLLIKYSVIPLFPDVPPAEENYTRCLPLLLLPWNPLNCLQPL
jgi:hypothetical protein